MFASLSIKALTQERDLSRTKAVFHDADSAIHSGRLTCRICRATSTVPTPEKWLDTDMLLDSRLPGQRNGASVFKKSLCLACSPSEGNQQQERTFVFQDTSQPIWPKYL